MGPPRRRPLRRARPSRGQHPSPQRPKCSSYVRRLRGAEALDGAHVAHPTVPVVHAHEVERPSVLGAGLPAPHRVSVVAMRGLDAVGGAGVRGAHHEQGVGESPLQAGDAIHRDRIRPSLHPPGGPSLRPGVLRARERRQRREKRVGDCANLTGARTDLNRPRALPIQQLVVRSHNLRRRRDSARQTRVRVRAVHAIAVPQADVALPRTSVLRALIRQMSQVRLF